MAIMMRVLASWLIGAVVALLVTSVEAHADTGEVQLQGLVTLDAGVPGTITVGMISVVPKSSAEPIGTGGTKCTVNSVTSDKPDPSGVYPGAIGAVSLNLSITKGGGGSPDPGASCLVTVAASGTDGSSSSASGSNVVVVGVSDLNTTLTGVDITVFKSKAIAELDKQCFSWVKRQLRRRSKCNFLLLRDGGTAGAPKCKDACRKKDLDLGLTPPCELTDPTTLGPCDESNVVEKILAFAHESPPTGNDQQSLGDPSTAQGVTYTPNADGGVQEQVVCQKQFGKAAFAYMFRRTARVRANCVAAQADNEACRARESQASAKPLGKIDTCVVNQTTDPGTGRLLPQVQEPCSSMCISGGVIDRKCLKSCFQGVLDGLSDALIGEVAVCGNGIMQPAGGEFCDDGNTTSGDCCSSTCTVENLGDQTCGVGACQVTVPVCQDGAPFTCIPGTPGAEGPAGDPSCSDGIDNDCDGTTDGADANCL